jgi:maltokinase
MPQSSLSRTALRTCAGPFAEDAASAGLLDSLSPLLAEWLPRQRWFAGKGRPISGFSLVAATELLPCTSGTGLLHLLVRVRQPGGVGRGVEQASADCYQLLLGVRDVLPDRLATSLIGRPADGPLRDRAVYEALDDVRPALMLLERLRSPCRVGVLRFVCAPNCAVPSGLLPVPLTVEQSNSSVVYGNRYILKVFRRVESGVNPDLELPLALARHGSARVPAPTAWFEAGAGGVGQPSEPVTLGVLQPFLPGCSDGWRLALNALAERRHFTGEARGLGRATAQVHTGLAEVLPTAVVERSALERTAADMTARLERAGSAVPELRPYRRALGRAFHALAGLGRRGHICPAQRVHGDLHLGQVLEAPDGRWSLIDFEGEPARPLAERRGPQPVVRDIATMLRSFDYAACQQPSGTAASFAREWADANRAAFCAGYADASGSDPREEATLLRAYETDKTVYEVLYEARHRPAWLHVPISAVRRLAASPVR